MQVTSFEFLIFFLAVAVVNFLLPKKFRMYWLLASSYYFYMRLAPVYALFLVFSTIVTYAAGIFIEKNSDAKAGAACKNSTVSGIKSITLTAGAPAMVHQLTVPGKTSQRPTRLAMVHRLTAPGKTSQRPAQLAMVQPRSRPAA